MGDDGLNTHTMWSETLLDGLYDQLRSSQSDDIIRTSLQELIDKDFPASYLVRCVQTKVGADEARRIENLTKGMSRSAAAEAADEVTAKKGGLMDSLRGLLK